MKHSIKILLLFVALLFAHKMIAQNLSQIIIDNRGNQDIISFLADESIIVNMTKDGKITDWGIVDNISGQNFFPPRLLKYMGREEYYSPAEDEAYRGKIKYLGRTLITYYTSTDDAALKGKVKTLGNNYFTYYNQYDNESYKSNIKTSGSVSFTYYSSFDDESYRGKIKSVGSVSLGYYGSIDDKAFKGKIKNIDRIMYTYYSSYDRKELAGALKTGSPMQAVGGIKYLIKNY